MIALLFLVPLGVLTLAVIVVDIIGNKLGVYFERRRVRHRAEAALFQKAPPVSRYAAKP